jgi:undecaprenyl-diphosphatase
MVDVAKIVTALGALPVAGGLALLVALVLAVKRRPIEFAVLVLSALAIVAAVQITKGAVDRPRPPHPLAGSLGSAYPSGHSAYSAFYVALAVIAARVFDAFVYRVALVILALAATAAIGWSRVFLQVHWWSDVAGGWGLGAAIFGFVAAIGLIVDFFRNNEDPARPAGTDRIVQERA